MSKKYPAPAGLSKKANARWNDVVRRWDLRPDELRVLEDACREMDIIDSLQKVLAKDGPLTTGSMGQVVAHPALGEIRQHRSVLAGLLRSLKLPDDAAGAGVEAEARSSAARKAAQSRWAVHHGAAA